MTAPQPASTFPVPPDDRTRPLARDSGASLSRFVDRDLDIKLPGHPGTVTLPAAAVRLLVDVLAQLAQGNAVTVVPHRDDLTIDEAAAYLGVSPAFLDREIDGGSLSAHGEKTDRSLRLDELLRYRRLMYDRRRAALDELSSLDQELGLV